MSESIEKLLRAANASSDDDDELEEVDEYRVELSHVLEQAKIICNKITYPNNNVEDSHIYSAGYAYLKYIGIAIKKMITFIYGEDKIKPDRHNSDTVFMFSDNLWGYGYKQYRVYWSTTTGKVMYIHTYTVELCNWIQRLVDSGHEWLTVEAPLAFWAMFDTFIETGFDVDLMVTKYGAGTYDMVRDEIRRIY